MSLVDVIPVDDYEDLVVKYWNWLLGGPPDQPEKPVDNVLYMRACYNYQNVVSQENALQRINGCGVSDHLVTVTGGVTTDTRIFLPMVDACFNASQMTAPGLNFDEADMRGHCNEDIDDTELPPQHFPQIERVSTEEKQNIVLTEDIGDYRIDVPNTGTFELYVHPGSPLNGRLEDPLYPHGPHNAVAVGYYLVFTITHPGEHVIISRTRGRGDYRANMHYTINVESTK